MSLLRHYHTALLLLALLGVAHPAVAFAEVTPEMRIKVAYLYNFMKFVYWPDSKDDLNLCVVASADFEKVARENMVGRKAQGRAIQVRTVRSDELQSCQVVYSDQALSKVGPGVLTVGEGQDFVRDRGMIAFAVVQDRVRFYINLDALRAAQLRADSQLLVSALDVIR